MKDMHIPTVIKRELVKFGVDCDRSRIVRKGMVAIHSSGKTIIGFTHIEGNTLVQVRRWMRSKCHKNKDVGIGPEGVEGWCSREARLLLVGRDLVKLG